MTAPARAGVGFAVVACLMAGSPSPGAAGVRDTEPAAQTLRAPVERVSVTSAEQQAHGASEGALVSANGRFAVFQSAAPNLVAGDTNAAEDVFLRDRVAGRTIRVSVDRDGQQRALSSFAPTMSPDARFITFSSQVARRRIAFFVYDRKSGEAKRVFSDVGQDDGSVYPGVTGISASGRFLVFDTPNQLVPRDRNLNEVSVYLLDRRHHRFIMVSLTDKERDVGDTCCGAISASGRLIAFPTHRGVLVRDRVSHTTELASASLDGQIQPSGFSGQQSISPGGRFVTFTSEATNLVPHDTNRTGDVFVRDLQAQTTARVSVSTAGRQANDFSYESAVSNGGRYIAFVSNASSLVSGDDNNETDLFVRDRRTGTTRCISVDEQGNPVGGSSLRGISLSPSGRWVGFASDSPRVVPGDTNGAADAFVTRLH